MCPRKSAAALSKGKDLGSWRPGPLNLRFRFHHDPTSAGCGPEIDQELLWDPRMGELKNEADRPIVCHIVDYLAEIYQQYILSGSTAWDLTMDVRHAPQWLKDIMIMNESRPSHKTSCLRRRYVKTTSTAGVKPQCAPAHNQDKEGSPNLADEPTGRAAGYEAEVPLTTITLDLSDPSGRAGCLTGPLPTSNCGQQLDSDTDRPTQTNQGGGAAV